MKQRIADFLNIFVDLQKALVMLLVIAIGIIFRVQNLISGSDMVDLLKNCVIAFFAVKGFEHISTSVSTYYSNQGSDDPSDPSTPPPPPGVKL